MQSVRVWCTLAFMNTDQRTCLACNKALHGRADKKFCDDYCRSAYNNRLMADEIVLMKRINGILKKNRRLLLQQIPAGEEMGKCSRKKLLEAGYDFTYFTHQYTNKKGNVYGFVYEYGYLPIEGDWVLIVKRSKQD